MLRLPFFAACCFLLASLSPARAGVLLSSLNQTIAVSYSVNGALLVNGGSVQYNSGQVEIQWSLNSSVPANTSGYSQAVVQLCFGAPSSQGRSWRAPNNDLSKAKNCPTTIAKQAYSGPSGNHTTWKANVNTPGGVYFVRVTILNSTAANASVAANAIAFGQTTNANMTTNLLQVVPYSGTAWYLDLVVVLFSVFFVGCLAAVLMWERYAKKTK